MLLSVVTGHIQCHSNYLLISYKDSIDVRVTLSQGTEDTAVWEVSGPSLHGISCVIPPGDVEGTEAYSQATAGGGCLKNQTVCV